MNDISNIKHDFKTICNKENIFLNKDKINNSFLISFHLENKNKNIDDFISLEMYDLLYNLNKDTIDKIQIKNRISNNEVDVLFIFKPFGQDLGFKNKYMYVNTRLEVRDNKKIFISNDKEYPFPDELKNYEKLNNIVSYMIVDFLSQNKANINYFFKLETPDILPIYMENIFGILMKKMFIQLKRFIEIIQ